MTSAEAEGRLAALASRVHQEAGRFAYYRRPWVKPRVHPSGKEVHNVFIVGAGHCGSAIYVGLRASGIDRVGIIDACEKGREGVWAQYDRMHSLRTPKELTGPDWGLPSLTFQAYCEARFGEAYWAGLKRVIRTDYADYMAWYRTTMEIPVQNETRLVRLDADGDLLRLECDRKGERELHYARNVILATGYATEGDPFIPEYFRGLPRSRYAHTTDAIDFPAMKGKRVGILGHGAGGFDCAGMALEAGAATVDLCYRRAQIPTVNPYRWFEFPGFIAHFFDLDDAMRWSYSHQLLQRDQPPAQGGYDRAMAFANFTAHSSTNWLAVEDRADGVSVRTTGKAFVFDFLISATGLTGDVKFCPELATLNDHIATWADRYSPPAGLESAKLGSYAYLGPHFEFTEKRPGEAPHLAHIFAFSSGAGASHGPSVTSLSGLRYSLHRVLQGVRSRLFTQDAAAFFADYQAYRSPELTLSPEGAPVGKPGQRDSPIRT